MEHDGIFESDTLGRVYTVHPNYHECFFLRMLLHTIKGPSSFDALKTVNGVVHPTYREACLELGLLENDNQWDLALIEAALISHPFQIRNLFAIILTTCTPSNPKDLWDKHEESMTEDILAKAKRINHNSTLEYNETMFNECLILLEDKCIEITNQELSQLGLPAPNRDMNNRRNKDLLNELQYDTQELKQYVKEHKKKLNDEQLIVYESIMQHINNKKGGIFFLDAPGGTGKTFMLKLILAEVRSREEIAIATASTGIAATLLDGGRTMHSFFKLPFNLTKTETPMCNINKNSGKNQNVNKYFNF